MLSIRVVPPSLDLIHLNEQTFGDRGLERDLLRLFRHQCRLLLPTIASAATTKRVRGEAAHALKGAARAVGAARIALITDAIERAAERGMADATLDRLAGKLEPAIVEVENAIGERTRAAA